MVDFYRTVFNEHEHYLGSSLRYSSTYGEWQWLSENMSIDDTESQKENLLEDDLSSSVNMITSILEGE